MTDFQRGIIDLIKSALFAQKVTLPSDFDWTKTYEFAKKHQIIPLCFYGAYNSGIEIDGGVKSDFEASSYRMLAVNINQKFMLERLYDAFEKAEIDYMPVKGAVLKPLYPKGEMRQMSDTDILIKPQQYDQIKRVMQELGFYEHYESDHEFIWKKNSFFTIELHKRLIPSYNKDYYAYFGEGWQLAKPTDTSRFVMSNEDSFIYIFTHFSKHYRDGGIGIRHFVDFDVFLREFDCLDFDYIEKELAKLQLLEFYKNCMKTLKAWFYNADNDSVTDLITATIFESGSYGTRRNSIIANAVKLEQTKRNRFSLKIAKALKLFFLPYKKMCIKYPFLIKMPIFLPFMWVVRAFGVVFNKKKTLSYYNSFKILTEENVDGYKRALDVVGLSFNFKE